MINGIKALRSLRWRIAQLTGRKVPPSTDIFETTFEAYEVRLPSSQNSIDLFDNWITSFAPEYGVDTTGTAMFFRDDRIFWGLDQIGSLEGKSVLELGPLEGAHTNILNSRNPAQITAIEAHKEAYLKCLISKEIYDLQRAKFLLGDFVKFLEQTDQVFDLILASGILYHMREPVRLLELIGQKSKAVILWTHYFDAQTMPEGEDWRGPFSGQRRIVEIGGRKLHLHERSYYNGWKTAAFCGGPENSHYWMEKADILYLLEQAGFDDIRIGQEHPDHPNGPCFLLTALKS